MYLIRKDNKYYLTYNKDVADKFNSVHNGYMCDVTLLEEHNIPEKEEPPKYIMDSGRYEKAILSLGEITSGRPLQMTSPFTYNTVTIPHEAITTANDRARSLADVDVSNSRPYRIYNTYTSSTSADIPFTAATTRIGTTS